MRILGTTSSGNLNYAYLQSASANPGSTSSPIHSNTIQGFATGNGYFVKYGGNTSGVISYSTSLANASWTQKTVQTDGVARSVSYIDTGTNKYWVYGNDTTSKCYYTTDGTPQGTLSNVTPYANGTTFQIMVYCPGANRPFVALGGASNALYVATSTSISTGWTTAATISVTSASYRGVMWGPTGTGSDKRLIFCIAGDGNAATYFSGANDTTTYTLQTLTSGDARGLAHTGTHLLYLGANSLGRAPISTFSNTTGAQLTYSTPTNYGSQPRGLAASPSGNGLCYIGSSGQSTEYILVSTDHGATWSMATAQNSHQSNIRMYMDATTAISYDVGANNINYINY